MMHRRLRQVIWVAVSTVSWAQAPLAPPSKLVEPLRPLLEAMYRAKVSGSLEFVSHCDDKNPPEFPKFRAPSATSGTPLEIARETLADNPAMEVRQDDDGTIRMIESGVPTDLMKVKISHIVFESDTTAIAAIRHVILKAPEVVTFMKAHKIERVLGEGLSRGSGPTARPNQSTLIPGPMADVTLSQALDQVVKTYPGIWVYVSCPRNNGNGRFVDFLILDHQHPGLFENLD